MKEITYFFKRKYKWMLNSFSYYFKKETMKWIIANIEIKYTYIFVISCIINKPDMTVFDV